VMQGIRQVQDAWWNNRVELPALPEPEQVAVVIVEQE
jgi:hypothetical protein